MNYALIYVSKASQPMSAEDLRELSDQASSTNAKLDLTGLLLYSGKYFMQILEGDYEVLNTLFAKIANDPRHHSVDVLMGTPSTVRLFPQWSMGVIDVRNSAQIDAEVINDICEQAEQQYENVKDAALEALKLFTYTDVDNKNTAA